MKKLSIIFIVFLSAGLLKAQNPNLGTAGAQFLEIPVGAKASALGKAFMGMADDASSVFWNPSGILHLKKNSAHFSYMNWFDMFDFNAASVTLIAGDAGTLAASVTVFSMDEMEVTTELQPEGTGRYFDAQDIALGVTYARNLTDKFGVGITIKYIQQSIWNETASGVAFDVGTQYNLGFKNFTIAMSMANFGADLKFEGEDLNVTHDINEDLPDNRLTKAALITQGYALPLKFQVGIAMDVFQHDFVKMRAGIDAVHPNDNDERLNFGTEFGFFDRVYLRGGYKYNYDDEDFSFGAGVNLPLSDVKIIFDYAYSVYDILPSVHHISFGLEF